MCACVYQIVPQIKQRVSTAEINRLVLLRCLIRESWETYKYTVGKTPVHWQFKHVVYIITTVFKC
jgi:hypothetical protein